MEGVGAAANVIAVVDLSIKVISLCSQYAEDVRGAKSEIKELHNEVTTLRRVARSARRLLQRRRDADLEASRDMETALRESLKVLRELKKALRPKPARRLMRHLNLGVLKWPFKSREVRRKIRKVERCSNLLSLSLNVDQTDLTIRIHSNVHRVDETTITIEQRTLMSMLPTALGALYGSRDEEHGALCLPNTRVQLLQEIDNWINNRQAPTIFWLSGMAGTGKSTISRTVAALSASHHHVGASFFFKRGEADRGTMARFYTTIAYQLVRSMPDLIPHIRAAIDGRDSVIEKSASQQFEKLILQPLMRVRHKNRVILTIVVDGLDECDGDNDVQRLISLLPGLKNIKNLRVRVLITSRPELPIRLGFHEIRGHYRDLVLHEIPETIVEHDIDVFFNHKLNEIRRTYNNSVSAGSHLPKHWPGPRDTTTLVNMAVPLFIFATTVCRFLSDRRCGNPRQQLQKVLRYRTRSQESKMQATYLPPLEHQLRGLSSRERELVLEEFRTIVGTIVLLEEPLSASALSRLLDVSEDTVHVRLDMLHSVLNVPRSAHSPVRLLHLSFRDFLLDPEKQGTNQFWVDEKARNSHIALGTVNAVSFSPDSSLLASASSDSTVRIWRVETGERVREFNRHRRPVRDVKFSPDSTLIASKCDENIRIWKSDTGVQIETMATGGDHRECPVEFSPDSKLVAWIDEQGDLRILGLDTLRCIWIFRHNNFIDPRNRSRTASYSLHFSSDSRIIAVVVKETGFFSLWSVETGQGIRTHQDTRNLSLEVPRNGPRPDTSFVLVDDTTFMMAGNESLNSQSEDTILIRWVETGEVIQTLTVAWNARSRAISTQFSSDGAFLGSIHEDRTVKVWDIGTGQWLHFLSFSSDLRDMSFSPDMRLIASGSTDNMVHICSIGSGSNLPLSVADRDRIYAMVVSPDGSLVASFSSKRELALWRTDTGEWMYGLECSHLMEYLDGSSPKPSFAFLSSFLFCAWSSSTLWVYCTDSGQRIYETDKHRGSEVALSPDESRIAFKPHEDVIRIIQPRSPQSEHELRGGRRLSDAVFSPDSSRIAAISYNDSKSPRVYVWSVETGARLRRLCTKLPLNAIKAEISGISPDNNWIAVQWVVDEERHSRGAHQRKRVYTLEIMSVDMGERTVRFDTASSKPPGTCSFSSGSQHVAWVCGFSMRIWDTMTGHLIQHTNLGFSPSRVQFDRGRDYPLTNFGRVSVNSPYPEEINGTGTSPRRLGYGVSADRSWLLWNDTEFFWLPPRFRPHEGCAVEISGSTIIIGSETGIVWLLLWNSWSIREHWRTGP
ncbi:hypothetical protein ACHAPT_011795 [Fusarium lateritium]